MPDLSRLIKNYFELLKQFGVSYALFRAKYELSKRLGIYNKRFPTTFKVRRYLTLQEWRQGKSNTFIFDSKEAIDVGNQYLPTSLKNDVEHILQGKINFFYKEWKDLGFTEESYVHPVSQYKYPAVHWTQIPIYDKEIGDIKYVWEKSKFSFVLYLIRYDLYNDSDHSKFILDEIDRWITDNPPNVGPQYVCSQEIGIRLINWSFVLFFYKYSPYLMQDIFDRIISSIDVQLDHIFQNIRFSKVAVRNNHAMTETLSLYLISLYFPFLTHATKYKKLGKKWFEEEVEYQLFKDGSDSQYSFNYHRVKIQLLTLAISSAKANNEIFAPIVYERAEGSLQFLYQKIGNMEKGQVSNFGYNDGSIYFKFNEAKFDNYLPQLIALAAVLGREIVYAGNDPCVFEDRFWLTQKLNKITGDQKPISSQLGLISYKDGGYVQIRDGETLTLFKTPELISRPTQDDFFHVDIWANGFNLLRDAGSYSYNTDAETSMFFNGIKGHNTASLNGQEHMMKGPRFTWLYKPRHIQTTASESAEYYEIVSEMEVFFPINYSIQRTTRKYKAKMSWEITDRLLRAPKNAVICQFWNINRNANIMLSICAVDIDQNILEVETTEGFYSGNYGVKESTSLECFSSNTGSITTLINISDQ